MRDERYWRIVKVLVGVGLVAVCSSQLWNQSIKPLIQRGYSFTEAKRMLRLKMLEWSREERRAREARMEKDKPALPEEKPAQQEEKPAQQEEKPAQQEDKPVPQEEKPVPQGAPEAAKP